LRVHGRDHVEFIRTGEHLLQRDVGDGILDDDLARFLGGVHLRVGFLLALGGLDAFPLLPGEYVSANSRSASW
jgi:hypothetical protein